MPFTDEGVYVASRQAPLPDDDSDLFEVDLRDERSPLTLLRANQMLKSLQAGTRVMFITSHRRSLVEFRALASGTGNRLVRQVESDGRFRHILERR